MYPGIYYHGRQVDIGHVYSRHSNSVTSIAHEHMNFFLSFIARAQYYFFFFFLISSIIPVGNHIPKATSAQRK
jgi:hypothetical protein